MVAAFPPGVPQGRHRTWQFGPEQPPSTTPGPGRRTENARSLRAAPGPRHTPNQDLDHDPLHPRIPQLTQAFRRIALNANPHWVTYYSSNQTPGSNDQQASVGHITSTGKDYRHRAGKPYWYTQELIDERKLGFGFWTRSNQAPNSTYRFACYDIEPINRGHTKRVDRSPSHWTCKETREEAWKAYKAWKKLARTKASPIIWVLLVGSSQHHYHVWALFREQLTQAQHDNLMAQADTIHGGLMNLDKDTRRGKGRFGDQFRAPWSRKKGRRSEAIAMWIRDEDLLVQLGEDASPPKFLPPASRRSTPLATNHTDPTTVQETLLAHALVNYPIDFGTRHVRQRNLIAHLIARGHDEDTILEVGQRWLVHFRDRIDPAKSDKALLRLFRSCLNATLNNPHFKQAEPPRTTWHSPGKSASILCRTS